MTVFILGAGVMQIPAIRAAQEMGWFVACADGNAAAPGASLADAFFPVDLKDFAGLEAVARSLKAGRGLEAVFTAGTDFSASVAWVAERLHLPGIPYEAALRASDKLKMRAAFAAAGVPSPAFVSVDGKAAPDAASRLAVVEAAGLSLPLVVKPADNMGARGCRLARSPSELAEACDAAIGYSRTGRAIVEEYMDGPEFSLDAVVEDGKVRLRGFADRHIYFSPYFVELGHTMPSVCSSAIRDEVIGVFEAGVAAIGITRGAAKGDMKYCPSRGSAMVGEIAARLSGGYMSGWTYPYASGVDVTREALELSAGLSPERKASDRGWVAAERAFISIPGRVSRVMGLQDAESLPYIKDLFCRVRPGDDCVFPSNNVEKCGNVIAQAPDRGTAVSAAESAIRGILVRLAPGRPETESFLGQMASGGEAAPTWPPDAFNPPAAIRSAIDGLSVFENRGSAASGLFILSLPEESGIALFKERDWAGLTLLEAAEVARKLSGASFIRPAEAVGKSGPAVVGTRFWTALVRGGAQAALYVLDTMAGGEGAL